MISLAVTINWRLGMGFPDRNPLVAFFGRAFVAGVLMLFAAALIVLGQGVPPAPVAFAAAYVVVEVRRTSRLTVRRRYWGIEDAPTARN
jgi:hypothetical protein